jgi:hypothetical protein
MVDVWGWAGFRNLSESNGGISRIAAAEFKPVILSATSGGFFS